MQTPIGQTLSKFTDMPAEAPHAARRDRLAAVWMAAALAALLFNFVRGFHVPNRWAATQAQIDCRFGLIARCAYGEAFRLAHIAIRHGPMLVLVSGLLLLALAAAAAWRAARSPLRRDAVGASLICVVGASFVVGYLADIDGYLDIPLALIATLAVGAPRRWRAGAVALAAIVGVLVHEMYLFVLLPVTLLVLIVDDDSPERAQNFRPAKLAAPAIIGLVAAAVAYLLAWRRPASEAVISALQREITAGADFPVDARVFDVYRRSAAANAEMMHHFGGLPFSWPDQMLAGAAVTAPILALFAWLLVRGWRGVAPVVRWLAFAAVLTPLALHAFAWDAIRWDGFVVFDAFLAATILAAAAGPPVLVGGERRGWLILAGVLTLIELAGGVPLMNYEEIPRWTLWVW